jgi:hypothetical protein
MNNAAAELGRHIPFSCETGHCEGFADFELQRLKSFAAPLASHQVLTVLTIS